jgi:ABC-type glycerol-3-phosphate transport system substrate-binding protein
MESNDISVRASRRAFLRITGSYLALTSVFAVIGCATSGQPSTALTPQKSATTQTPVSFLQQTAQPKVTGTAQVAQASTTSPSQVSISMWFHDQLYVKFWQNRAKEFEQKHNNIKFSWDIIQIPNSQLADKFIGTVTAGQGAPDIIGVENGWFPRLLKQDRVTQAMVDLKPLMVRDGYDPSKYKRLELYSWKERIYGLESGLSECVYYYRKDIFDAAGIQPPFDTYEDFITAGKKLKQAGHFMLPVDTSNGMANWQTHALQAGGQLFDRDGNVVINSPGNAQCLTLMKRCLDEGVGKSMSQGFWGADLIAAYKDGTVAGVPMADWYSDYVLKENLKEQAGKWRIAYLPRYEKNGARTSATGGTGHGITVQSKIRDLVWELLSYGYLTKENQVKRYLEIHYFPNLVDAWTDPRITGATDDYFGGQEVGKLFAEIAPEIPVFYTGPWRPEATQKLATEAWVPVLTGKKTVEKGLKDAQDETLKIINASI